MKGFAHHRPPPPTPVPQPRGRARHFFFLSPVLKHPVSTGPRPLPPPGRLPRLLPCSSSRFGLRSHYWANASGQALGEEAPRSEKPTQSAPVRCPGRRAPALGASGKCPGPASPERPRPREGPGASELRSPGPQAPVSGRHPGRTRVHSDAARGPSASQVASPCSPRARQPRTSGPRVPPPPLTPRSDTER